MFGNCVFSADALPPRDQTASLFALAFPSLFIHFTSPPRGRLVDRLHFLPHEIITGLMDILELMLRSSKRFYEAAALRILLPERGPEVAVSVSKVR